MTGAHPEVGTPDREGPVGGSPPVISVITCAHNPRSDYLARVLDSLAGQTLPVASWEFLLVDSASREPLGQRVDLGWHPRARCVREDEPGLTRARLRGIAESAGELLVFVDDDNVLDPDFLERVVQVGREMPMLGAWSGQSRPGFDETPPEWTRRYWGNLVIREVPGDVWSNLPLLAETMPCGAGLCVRREVARHYKDLHDSGRRAVVLDRVGTSLISGGDNDLAACACDLGLGMGVISSLRLTHLIPAGRLEEDYLVRLAEGIAFSAVILRSLRLPREAVAPRGLKTRVANLLRLTLMSRRERRFFRATLRGESRALALLSGLQPQGDDSPTNAAVFGAGAANAARVS